MAIVQTPGSIPIREGPHRRRRRRRRGPRMGAAIACGALAVLAAMVLGTWPVSKTSQPAPSRASNPSVADARTAPGATPPTHQNYRYSVIPGGAHDRQELVDAINRDDVIADHYRMVSLDRVRVEHLTERHRAYVSYRIGDRVYWTKHKVTLPAGEAILTDGVTRIRARCGNCIAEERQLPTSDEEPDTVEFDALAPAVPAAPPSRVATVHPSPIAANGRWGLVDLSPLLPTSIGRTATEPSLVTAPGLGPIRAQDHVPEADMPSAVVAFPTPDGKLPEGSFPGETAPVNGNASGGIPGAADAGNRNGGGDNTGPGEPGDRTRGGGNIGGGNPVGGGSGATTPGGVIPGVGIPDGLVPDALLPEPTHSGSAGGANDSIGDAPAQPAPVPEPTTIALLGTGAAAALWRRRRRRLRR